MKGKFPISVAVLLMLLSSLLIRVPGFIDVSSSKRSLWRRRKLFQKRFLRFHSIQKEPRKSKRWWRNAHGGQKNKISEAMNLINGLIGRNGFPSYSRWGNLWQRCYWCAIKTVTLKHKRIHLMLGTPLSGRHSYLPAISISWPSGFAEESCLPMGRWRRKVMRTRTL